MCYCFSFNFVAFMLFYDNTKKHTHLNFEQMTDTWDIR